MLYGYRRDRVGDRMGRSEGIYWHDARLREAELGGVDGSGSGSGQRDRWEGRWGGWTL